MKKVLGILLTIAMVSSVFAAEPVANVNVAEFTGEASVAWQYNLDTKDNGFNNATKVVLKLNLFDGGDKSTTGEGVWGELKIKTDSDTFIGWENTTDGKINSNKGMEDGAWLGLKIVVDTAKLHFGDNAYVGITSGDTQTGKLKMTAAIRSQDNDDNAVILPAVGPADYSQGIVFGYDADEFGVAADFRSKAGYTSAYATAVEVTLKPITDLKVVTGGSFEFNTGDEAGKAKNIGYSASAEYKLAINDTFYVLPAVGFAGSNVTDNVSIMGVDAKSSTNSGALVAGVLLGWGETADENAGVYFLDDDNAKKVTPGVGLVLNAPLYNLTSLDIDGVGKGTEAKTSQMELRVSAFSGEIVPNLTFAASYTTKLGKVKTKTTFVPETGDKDTNTTEGTDFTDVVFEIGAKYKMDLDTVVVTPQVGFKAVENDNQKFVKAGVEVTAPAIENTTFSAEWVSNDLTLEKNTKGTLTLTTKIAL